jgi:hypothetical protein
VPDRDPACMEFLASRHSTVPTRFWWPMLWRAPPAPIWMDSLERVSAAALAALRKKDTITLPPDEKLTIVP